MKADTAIGHFTTQRELAETLDIHESQVTRWKKDGLVPIKYALKLNNITGGELDLALQDYKGE